MKILQINKFHYPKAGADRYYFDLSQLLEKNGHQVIHFAMQDEKNVESPYSKYFVSQVDFSKVRLNKEGLRVAGRMLYSFEAKRKIEELIRDTKPDIAHIHNIYHQLSPSILPVLKKHGIPIVMTAHDYKLISPNYSMYHDGKICEHSKIYRFWNTVIRRCVKSSYLASLLSALEMGLHKLIGIYEKNINAIIVPSKFMRDKFIEYGQDEDKIKYIRYSIEAKKFNPGEIGDYLVFFGRLSEEKGIGVLLEAVKLVPEAKLKIVGSGPLEEKLKDQVKNLFMEKQVEFLGYKKGGELWDIVGNSLAVVLPSEWYENAPVSILEALALARPVLGSNIGGIPELIKEGETGLLFEPANSRDLAGKIKWAYENQNQVAAMGRRARQWAEEEFRPEEHYKKIMEVYQGLKRG